MTPKYDLDDVIYTLSLSLYEQKKPHIQAALQLILQYPNMSNDEIALRSGMSTETLKVFKCRNKDLLYRTRQKLELLEEV